MKLSNIIDFKKEVINESSEYEDVYALITEAKKFQKYDFEKFHEKMFAKMPTLPSGQLQVNKLLMDRNGEDQYGPNHPWVKRDLGKEVLGKPNAKELMTLVGDFKTFLAELKKVRQGYKDALSQWNSLYDSLKKEVETVRDDDTEGKGAKLKSKYLEGYKKYVDTIKSLDKQVKHYVPLFNQALAKMNKFEVNLASTRTKEEIASNVARSKEASKERFNQKIGDWKSKVKSLASLKKQES